MKRVLITGGAGFIGSNLIRRIVSPTVKVTIIDNLVSGNINNLLGVECEFIEADIVNFDFGQLEKQDEVYHLACPASPSAYQSNPINTLETCYNGTKNVLDFGVLHSARVLFTSTSEVYGDPMESPQSESYCGNVKTATRRACYDEGKRIAETLCYEYNRMGLRVGVARIFNTYGPMMAEDDGRVVSNFISQALNKKPLSVFGTGKQTRSFCYVDDTVWGLVKFMELDTRNLQVINLGNDHEITVYQLAHMIMRLTGTELELQYHPLPDADPQMRRPSLECARTMLQWVPKVDLEEGIYKTIEYFKRHMD